jgi:hypothetical protein
MQVSQIDFAKLSVRAYGLVDKAHCQVSAYSKNRNDRAC